MKIHHTELAEMVTKRINAERGITYGLDTKDVYDIIVETTKTITDILSDTDDEVILRNLGRLGTKRIKANTVKNFNGESYEMPPYKRITFRTSNNLRKRLKT